MPVDPEHQISDQDRDSMWTFAVDVAFMALVACGVVLILLAGLLLGWWLL